MKKLNEVNVILLQNEISIELYDIYDALMDCNKKISLVECLFESNQYINSFGVIIFNWSINMDRQGNFSILIENNEFRYAGNIFEESCNFMRQNEINWSKSNFNISLFMAFQIQYIIEKNS